MYIPRARFCGSHCASTKTVLVLHLIWDYILRCQQSSQIRYSRFSPFITMCAHILQVTAIKRGHQILAINGIDLSKTSSIQKQLIPVLQKAGSSSTGVIQLTLIENTALLKKYEKARMTSSLIRSQKAKHNSSGDNSSTSTQPSTKVPITVSSTSNGRNAEFAVASAVAVAAGTQGVGAVNSAVVEPDTVAGSSEFHGQYWGPRIVPVSDMQPAELSGEFIKSIRGEVGRKKDDNKGVKAAILVGAEGKIFIRDMAIPGQAGIIGVFSTDEVTICEAFSAYDFALVTVNRYGVPFCHVIALTEGAKHLHTDMTSRQHAHTHLVPQTAHEVINAIMKAGAIQSTRENAFGHVIQREIRGDHPLSVVELGYLGSRGLAIDADSLEIDVAEIRTLIPSLLDGQLAPSSPGRGDGSGNKRPRSTGPANMVTVAMMISIESVRITDATFLGPEILSTMPTDIRFSLAITEKSIIKQLAPLSRRPTPIDALICYVHSEDNINRSACEFFFAYGQGKGSEIVEVIDSVREQSVILMAALNTPFAVRADGTGSNFQIDGKLSTHAITIDRADLEPVKILGFGTFGRVFLARYSSRAFTALPQSETPDTVPCAVKILKIGASDDDCKKFVNEANLMFQLKATHIKLTGAPHPNLVQIFGVAVEARPLMVVLELVEYGDVGAALRSCVEKGIKLTTLEQMSMCSAVADGKRAHRCSSSLVETAILGT